MGRVALFKAFAACWRVIVVPLRLEIPIPRFSSFKCLVVICWDRGLQRVKVIERQAGVDERVRTEISRDFFRLPALKNQ
jgi:hypothetical protein